MIKGYKLPLRVILWRCRDHDRFDDLIDGTGGYWNSQLSLDEVEEAIGENKREEKRDIYVGR